jgi:putative acetyltransferase
MEIRRATDGDLDTLLDIWLRSVRATHAFLSKEDVEFFHPLVRDHGLRDHEMWVLAADDGQLMGFMGLSGNQLEALFLAPEFLRQGGGRRLVEHARKLKGPLTADVNEQNPEALTFYQAMGFVVAGRSELDSTGRPFPLLHLKDGSDRS